MLIVFCSDPLRPRQVDDAYAQEFATAEGAGFEHALIHDGYLKRIQPKRTGAGE